MQQINYDQVLLTFQCSRKHLVIDSKYYVYLLPKALILSRNPKQQNPKYIVQLCLTSKIHWITKPKTPILEQFGFQYKDEIKYFSAPTKDLQQLKDLMQGQIMYKEISDFYTPNYMLGKGGSSKVYFVTKKYDQSQFASKCVEKRYLKEDGGYNALFNEIQLMQRLKHENIIQLNDLYEGESTFYMILEYLEGKSLHELLNQRQSIFEQEQIQIIIKLILQAIDYMHSQGIMHRDLKPENIMFKYINQIQSLKIVDFGLATYQNIDIFPFPKCGTPGYVAPEIANLKDLTQKYTSICDEFSVGCIFYKLCTGKDLFPGSDYQEILTLNKKCNIVLDSLTIYKTPTEAIDLITQLLKVNPKERITAQQALQHPYFQQKYESKKTKFQQSNITKQNPMSQTQNFNPKVVNLILQKFEEEIVEDENTKQLSIPIMQNMKSFGQIQQYAYSPQNPQPRKNMKKFQTSEFDQYTQTISPQMNNFKPSLIMNCETYTNSPNPDKTAQTTRNTLVNKGQNTAAINFMYKIEEEQEEDKGIQK
ncbi:unnamed protein product [Paramecium pentaurelia]|uniref:Protein kinase domain-containing protein n=1 Tax=Paramecium pentaurelia TaxID=43138 RepID=A0A8S1T7S8_9CILI|nr:unnamed protein product [Paramecium pentaurelia]